MLLFGLVGTTFVVVMVVVVVVFVNYRPCRFSCPPNTFEGLCVFYQHNLFLFVLFGEWVGG